MTYGMLPNSLGELKFGYEYFPIFPIGSLQVAVFDSNWQKVFQDPIPCSATNTTQGTINNGTTSQWTVTLTAPQWATIVSKGGLYWVIEALATQTSAATYYWSAPFPYDAAAAAHASSFQSSSDGLGLAYNIEPPGGVWPTDGSTVWLPSTFTLTVYAVLTGGFGDGWTSYNQILNDPITVTDPDHLSASPGPGGYDFEKTIDIAASDINDQLLESLDNQGFYLVAEMDFSGGVTPPVLARFQGGAFQMSDRVVWILGGASLDQYTPHSEDFTNNITVASAENGVTVNGTITDTGGNSIVVSEDFSAGCSAVNAYLYDNDTTIDASGVNFSTSLYVLGGNGNNTIQGGAGNDVLIVGDGTNSLTDGNGNDSLSVGNGNNILVTGNGNDSVSLGEGNNTVSLGNGNDNLYAADGNNTIRATDGEDTITLGDGNNSVMCGNGIDAVVAGDGDNTVRLGNGNDSVTVGNGSNMIALGDGGQDRVVVTGDGDNCIDLAGGGTVLLGNGNNTVRDESPDGGLCLEAGNANGNNVFFLNAQYTGISTLTFGSGVNDLVLANIARNQPNE